MSRRGALIFTGVCGRFREWMIKVWWFVRIR